MPGMRDLPRQLIDLTLRWPWLAEQAGGRRVLRLQYEPGAVVDPSRLERHATALLGVRFALEDAVRVMPPTPRDPRHAVDGIRWIRDAGDEAELDAALAAADADPGNSLDEASGEPD